MNQNQHFFLLIIGLLVCSSLVLAVESSPWKSLNLFKNIAPISPVKPTISPVSVPSNSKLDSLVLKEVREHPKEVELILESSDPKGLSGKIKSQVKQQQQISPRLLKIKVDPTKLKYVLPEKKLLKIYTNRKYYSLLEESLPLMQADTFWESDYTGAGIKIGVLDTGLDSDHPMLEGKIILSKDFLGNNPEDRNGHGTHIAGIAAGKQIREGFSGVAPGAILINAKVLDDNGGGTTASIIQGINWAVDPDSNPTTDDGADIISLSLGAPSNTPDELINQALQDAINKGVKVVIASGNCGPQGMAGCGGFVGVTIPGSFQPAITVGAINDRLEWQSFSSGQDFGTYIKPDVVAPGNQVTSAVVDGYSTKSGTSMSAPFVSGAIALLLQKEGEMNQQEIKSLLEDNAVDMGAVGKDVRYGSGFVDLGVIIKSEDEVINNTSNNLEGDSFNEVKSLGTIFPFGIIVGDNVTKESPEENGLKIQDNNNGCGYAKEFYAAGGATGNIIPEGDNDWWKIRINGEGILTIQLDGPNSGTDFDLEVWDGCGGTRLCRPYTSSSDETCNVDVSYDWYYINIDGYSGTGSYRISADFEECLDDSQCNSCLDRSDGQSCSVVGGVGCDNECVNYCAGGVAKCWNPNSCSSSQCKDWWYGTCTNNGNLRTSTPDEYCNSGTFVKCASSNSCSSYGSYYCTLASGTWAWRTCDSCSSGTCQRRCDLSSASWGTTRTTEGNIVTLIVNGDSDCNGKTVTFVVKERDTFSGDDPVIQNPGSVTFSNGRATGTWISEWQDDGVGDPTPEYYFTATTEDGSIQSNNDLIVDKVPECTLTSSSWNQTTAVEGRAVTLTVQGDHCDNSDTASVKIMEVDSITGAEVKNENNRNISAQGFWDWLPFNDDDVADLGVRTFSNGKIEVPWTTIYIEDSENPKDTYRIAAQNNQNNIYEGDLIITKRCHDSDGDNYYGETNCGTTVDCNDTDNTIYPGRAEICDGKDNNCDGTIDEGVKNACGFCGSGCYKGSIISASPLYYTGGETSQITVKFRNDGDVGDISIEPNVIPSGWTIDDDSTDGDNQVSHNLATGAEGNFIFTVTAPSQDGSGTATFHAFWDGISNDNHDLDTKSYSLTSTLQCLDTDNDGYGSNNAASCRLRGTDCDDTNIQTYPNATERCDNKDNDCDNSIDETFNLNTDNANCGSCGIACSGDRQCINGRCTSTGCTIPDGSSSECDCDSNRGCLEFGNYVCELGSGWDACIQNFAPDECSVIDVYSCQGGNVYRCENVGGRKTLVLSDVCTYNEICPTNVGTTHQCQSTTNYDLTLEYASSGTIVNKQPGDTLLIKVRTNSQATLQYNTAVFSGSCSAASGERTCLLAVKENAAPGKYSFSLNDDVETVRVIENPYVLYVTNVAQLQERFSDAVGVKVLLAKIYEKAGQNDGLVYDLGREMGTALPFENNYLNYSEKLVPESNRDNANSFSTASFLRARCNKCSEIIVIGDDFVVPSQARTVYTHSWYFSGISENQFFTDTPYSISGESDFSDLDKAFSSNKITIVKPRDLPDSKLDLIKQSLVYLYKKRPPIVPQLGQRCDSQMWKETYVPTNYVCCSCDPDGNNELVDEEDIDVINADTVGCDSYDTLNDGSLILIGNSENNQLFSCFSHTFDSEGIEIQKNLWAPNEDKFTILLTSTQEHTDLTLQLFNNILSYGNWRYQVQDIGTFSYLDVGLLAASFAPYAETAVDVYDLGNDCSKIASISTHHWSNNEIHVGSALWCVFDLVAVGLPILSTRIAKTLSAAEELGRRAEATGNTALKSIAIKYADDINIQGEVLAKLGKEEHLLRDMEQLSQLPNSLDLIKDSQRMQTVFKGHFMMMASGIADLKSIDSFTKFTLLENVGKINIDAKIFSKVIKSEQDYIQIAKGLDRLSQKLGKSQDNAIKLFLQGYEKTERGQKHALQTLLKYEKYSDDFFQAHSWVKSSKGSRIFRADNRPPNLIIDNSEGFKPTGESLDYEYYVHESNNRLPSQFIGASETPRGAFEAAVSTKNALRGGGSWFYIIDPRADNYIDDLETLPSFGQRLDEKAIVAVGGIDVDDIVGAVYLQEGSDLVVDTISNVHYKGKLTMNNMHFEVG